MKKMIRAKQVQSMWSLSKSGAVNFIKKFEEELNRSDSKFEKKYLVRAGRTKFVDEEAFFYFMLNYDSLQDEVDRKRIKKFTEDKL